MLGVRLAAIAARSKLNRIGFGRRLVPQWPQFIEVDQSEVIQNTGKTESLIVFAKNG